MRLFLYYAFCTVKNTIRKLFRTWVAVVLVASLAIGLLLGFGIGILGSYLEESFPEEEFGDVGEGGEYPDEYPDDEIVFEELDAEDVYDLIELVVAAVFLVLLTTNLLFGEKSGSTVFPMADVNLLFPSPMKPQSVLLFRLCAQMGAAIFASIYLFIELPLLAGELSMPFLSVAAVFLAWILMLVASKLFSVLVFSLASGHPRLRRFFRPMALALLLLVGGAFYLYYSGSGNGDIYAAAVGFFNSDASRAIPVYGWFKGLVRFALEGDILPASLSLVGVLATVVLLAVLAYRVKADFYEDALSHSEETQELQNAVESGEAVIAKRKKERSERIRRDGIGRGAGASVFFFKTLYNRFRFAFLRVFTKTSLTYLVFGGGVALFLRFSNGGGDIAIPALVVAVLLFFRSLGNPLAEDTSREYFVMVPESHHAKVFFCELGGSLCCLFDLLPAFLVAALALSADPLHVILWIIVLVTLDFYASNFGLFVDLSLPTSLPKQVKNTVQILLIYLAIVPDAVLLGVGLVTGLTVPFLIVTAVVNLVIGGVMYALSPLFLVYGRR